MELNLKMVITLCFLSLVATFFTFPSLSLGDASDNATITVTVGAIAEITVNPSALSWSGVQPGQSDTSLLLDIRNTGSKNVSQIHAYVSTLDNETTRPYGSDDPDSYAAAGTIVIRNETNASIYYAGRIEWNWTEDITNKDLSNLGTACTGEIGNCSYGFVRNTSYEYMWAVSNGTGSVEANCNATGTVLALENDTDTGVAATRTPTTEGIVRDGGDEGYSYFHIYRQGHLLESSCVAVERNCTKIYMYKYDKRSVAGMNFGSCSNSTYVHAGDLIPNDVHTLTLNSYMPYGIPDGSLESGIIYVVAEASD